jgi:hypothetical protein
VVARRADRMQLGNHARVLLRPKVDDVTGPVILDAACGTGVSLSPGTHKQDP